MPVRQSWKTHKFLEFVEIIVMRNLGKENKSDLKRNIYKSTTVQPNGNTGPKQRHGKT